MKVQLKGPSSKRLHDGKFSLQWSLYLLFSIRALECCLFECIDYKASWPIPHHIYCEISNIWDGMIFYSQGWGKSTENCKTGAIIVKRHCAVTNFNGFYYKIRTTDYKHNPEFLYQNFVVWISHKILWKAKRKIIKLHLKTLNLWY